MKKGFIKKLLSGVITLTLVFGVSAFAKDKGYSIYDFKNVLESKGGISNTPYGYYQVSDFVTFMDNGSWHGYTLPSVADKDTLGGFLGPTILFESKAETIAINLSKEFNKLNLYKNGEKVNLASAKPDLAYYPGRLVQSYELRGNLRLTLKLIFPTDRTALIETEIVNLSSDKATFDLDFNGELYNSYNYGSKSYIIEPSLHLEGEDLLVKFDGLNEGLSENTKDNIFMTSYNKEVLTELSEDKKSYVTKLKNSIDLNPNKAFKINRTESFLFTEDEYLKEKEKIKDIKENGDFYFKENEDRWNSYIDNTLKEDDGVSKAYKNAAIKSMMTLVTNLRSPAGDLNYSGITPSVSYRWFNGLWAWDSWKNVVAYTNFDPEVSKDAVRVMFDYQMKEGHDKGAIPDAIYYDKDDSNYRNSKPPLAAWAVYNIYKSDGDVEFLKEMYEKLKSYHEWFYRNRDVDKNGIAEYGAMVHEAHYMYDEEGNLILGEEGTPLINEEAIIEAAAWESGMDNAIRFDKDGIGEGDIGVKVFENKNEKGEVVGYSINQESVDLNAYLYAEKAFLKYFAEVLGYTEDAKRFEKEGKYVADYINSNMFHEESGFYYDLQIDSKGENKKLLVNKGKGTEGYIPLWARLSPKDKARRVAENILSEDKFNLYVPFPTASKDNPNFDPSRYWRGPVWLDQALFGVEALENYGYKEDAKALACKLFDNASGVLLSSPINENYNPLTGEALHAKNFSWSAAAYYLLYKNTLSGGDNTTQNFLLQE